MIQVHEIEFVKATGRRKVEVGVIVPSISPHWSGGSPNESGVWHDQSVGGTVIKVIDQGRQELTQMVGGSGIVQCNGRTPDGKRCDFIDNIQVLQ